LVNAGSWKTEIRVYNDADRLNRDAADLVGETLAGSAAPVLGLCTGMTPVGLYAELVRRHEAGTLSFSRATVCNLDEYVGLAKDDPNGFRAFMEDRLLSRVDLPSERFHIPNGAADDPEAECRRFDETLERIGKRDLQVAGIGRNGHVGFNEPDDALPYGTRVARLTEDTIRANAAYFDPPERIPRGAVTMGIGSILESERLLLLAFGRGKSEAIAEALCGPLASRMPGSLLRLHPRLTAMIDRGAAELLLSRLKADPGLASRFRLVFDSETE